LPIYRLTDKIWFPPAEDAEGGIVAFGADLRPERLLLAYQSGIFPWYSEDEPIIWWSPDPRFVLQPEELRISNSMGQLLRKKYYQVTFDQNFESVIYACADAKRKGQQGTWLTEDMIQAYIQLFHTGHAHSCEVWKDGILVGGLYGVTIGKVFCGESMFHLKSNASKYGFISMVNKLIQEGIILIDCQVHTTHLESLGAKHISRKEFLTILRK